MDLSERGFFKGFGGSSFWGINDAASWQSAMSQLFASLGWRGRFASDNLVVWGRNLSFLDDKEFMSAFERRAETSPERSIIWRTHTVAWATRRALRLDGDLVECGTYRGTTARIVADLIGDKIGDKKYWLYDAFQWVEGDQHSKLEFHSASLIDFVRSRFEETPFVNIVQGYIPDSFEENAPEKVSFLHIDLNNVAAEKAALEFFWDRLCPGAVVLFDDFGWYGYIEQRLSHEEFAAARGHHILELPTGQGMLIRDC